MANVAIKNNEGVIVFDEEFWLNGLHPQYSDVIYKPYSTSLTFAISVDPYRRLGCIMPGYQPADLTNVSVVAAVQVASATNATFAYTIGGAKIHQITISSDTITTPTTFPRTIGTFTGHAGHTGAGGLDLIVYWANNSTGERKQYLFYAWNDNTDGDFGRYDFATTFIDDFFTQNPVSASTTVFTGLYPKKFVVGHDDILYISHGNLVKGYDGATGNHGTNLGTVLTLPKDYIITGFAKIEPRSLVIFAYKDSSASGSSSYQGQATAFFWNYLDLDPYKAVDLNDNYVSAGFEYAGTVACFTQGRATDKANPTRSTKLQIYDGSVFVPVAAVLENAPLNGGIDVLDDMIMWNCGSAVYSYGHPFRNTKLPKVLQKVGVGTGTSLGLLKSISTISQYISTGATTAGGLQKFNENFAVGRFNTSTVEPNFPPNMQGKITHVTVFYGSSSGGRSIQVLLLNSNGTTVGELVSSSDALTTIVGNSNVIDYKRQSNGAQFNQLFNGLILRVEWATGSGATEAPLIRRVEVYFELRQI